MGVQRTKLFWVYQCMAGKRIGYRNVFTDLLLRDMFYHLILRGFTLVNPNVYGYGAPTSGPSAAGRYTAQAGILSYYEVTYSLLCKKRSVSLPTNIKALCYLKSI